MKPNSTKSFEYIDSRVDCIFWHKYCQSFSLLSCFLLLLLSAYFHWSVILIRSPHLRNATFRSHFGLFVVLCILLMSSLCILILVIGAVFPLSSHWFERVYILLLVFIYIQQRNNRHEMPFQIGHQINKLDHRHTHIIQTQNIRHDRKKKIFPWMKSNDEPNITVS